MADLGLYENFVETARVWEGIYHRRQAVSLQSMDFAFDMPDSEFVKLFRLNKRVCLDLIEELKPFLPSDIRGTSSTTKVLTALNFYSSGSYQRYVGASAHHYMHQVSVSNCVRAVTQVLNNKHFREKYIRFPQTRGERDIIKSKFYERFGMPGVIGCIDGTHIAIVRPSDNEERFFNRKRYHSLNAQIVCDSDLNILSMDASHGGADHDSFVWSHHPIKRHLEGVNQSGNETVWLLGDSGYPLRACLLTPIVTTDANSPERYYTDLHCLVRNTVERCIGVLKSRWRCLLVDRKLHYHPEMAGYITNACVVLHNIANAARLTVEPLTPEEAEREASWQIHSQNEPTQSSHTRRDNLAIGEQIRNNLIARLWASRNRQ